MKKILFVLSLAVSTIAPAQLHAASIDDVSPTQSSCYGREYSEAHMQSRENQTVKKMTLKFSQSKHHSQDTMQLQLTAHLKKQKVKTNWRGEKKIKITYKPDSNTMFCQKDGNKLHCGVECDGGSADIYWDVTSKDNKITLVNNGFVMYGGCGSDIDENDMIWLTPNKGGDDVFTLYQLPEEKCR